MRTGTKCLAPALRVTASKRGPWRFFVSSGTRFSSRPSRRFIAGAVVAVVALGLLNSATGRESNRAPGPSAIDQGRSDARIGDLPERRTATSTTRRNPNGSLTTTLYGGQINYRASDGTWHPIDSALHTINEGGYAWRSGANAFELRFKPQAGPDFAEFRLGGRTFRWGAAGARADRAAAVDGGQITYPDAYPGTDLRYRVHASGVNKVSRPGRAGLPD